MKPSHAMRSFLLHGHQGSDKQVWLAWGGFSLGGGRQEVSGMQCYSTSEESASRHR